MRAQALEEAAEEARRLAKAWRDEADGNHSSHHSELRRTWADAAEKVADAIAALGQRRGSS
ncbi:hypothetical protein Rumeso_03468 [Rubellimicrobium mesophilum DSM 19309]|uniref:Uncharacterized protein n=1 Tax=Rubellimicrobium mesophilum DSM 19309 TaxID=442562 RepID=A0A017HKS9_9RHOB|nr:hypothetical protein Rumeso_03468 [Rubellimicrobium mesophilum DSM 19309]